MQSEADITQEENNRLLYQAKRMQKENSDITGALSNMVTHHACAEEEILNLNTMDSEKT